MFNKYNKILYPIVTNEDDNTTTQKRLADITTNIRVEPKLIDEWVNYDSRILIDGEMPEVTANEVYDNPYYHYAVMIANDRFDWRNDYPLTSIELQNYIKEKYADPNGIHHFEDVNGNTVDNIFSLDEQSEFSYPKNIIPITNAEYEIKVNEQKRNIKVVRPEYMSTVKTMIEKKVING